MMEEKNLRAFVHTLQMKSAEGINNGMVDEKPYFTKEKLRVTTTRGFLYTINPNKYLGNIYSYTDLKIIMDAIQKELDISEWEFDRIDITVDSEKEFEEVFKINKYLSSLASLHLKTKNHTDTRGGTKLEKRSLKVWKRKMDIEIYDKNLESNGKHPYTRCEFRFKLLDKKRVENLFKELYGMLDSLTWHIKELNEIKTKALYNVWLRENHTGLVRNVNEFYRKYSNEIFNVEISRSLYVKIKGTTGKYEEWIKNFRRNSPIEFISKRKLNEYIRQIKETIKKYEKREGIDF